MSTLFSANSKGCMILMHGYLTDNSLAFTPLIVSYTVEILPFALRAKGFNIFNFTISAALIFNQYVNPIALSALGWKYYVRDLSALCISS